MIHSMYKFYAKTTTTLITFCLLFSASVSVMAEDNQQNTVFHRAIIYLYNHNKLKPTDTLDSYFEKTALISELPENANTLKASYRVVNDFNEYIPVPDLNYLSYFARGIEEKDTINIQNTKTAIILDFAYPLLKSRESLKAADTVVLNIAKNHNGLIWDSETRELFSVPAWKVHRIDSWDTIIPIIESHITIHAYQNGDYVRAISLGMAKFGLPDIVINDFSKGNSRSMGNVINVVAQLMAEGHWLDENGQFNISIDALLLTRFKTELLESLYDNANKTITVSVDEATREEGDPENAIMELLFSRNDKDDIQASQTVAINNLFGWEDELSYVQHNDLIDAASTRAKKQLPEVRKEFNNGLKPEEYLLVKAPFPIPNGGDEWMWVEVIQWQGNKIKGILANEPAHIPDLIGGSNVVIDQDIVFDYLIQYSDGSSKGNETGELIMKFQQM
jgi:uncharacterized protein YegJ (DUF2314 family)